MEPSNQMLMAWDESSRLDALRALKLLDTPPEKRFDRVTVMAREVFHVPTALITLLDRDRQFFKSRQGMEACEIDRAISFCSHAILQDDVMVVEDASLDPRFADNPLVMGAPHIRFYAGKPLYSADRKKVGTLCIIDRVTRPFSSEDRARLSSLAAWAEREMNLLTADADALLRLEHKLRLAHVLEYAAEGMFSTTDTGHIESTNPAACAMFRYPATTLVGMNINQLIPLRDMASHTAFVDNLRNNVSGGARVSFEATGLRGDGEEFPMAVSFSMLEIGSRKFFTGIVRDITERKQQERIKSEFIAGVSHELRTPLTSILGALGMLRDDLAKDLSAEAGELIEIAYLNSRRLNTLVNDILDVEKLDAGMMQFDTAVCDAAAVVQEAVQLNQPFARKLGVKLIMQAESGALHIKVDHSRLTQVLTNLISNACKFSPAGQSVLVAASLIGKRVRLSVRDSGPGITDEFRSRIFQRFAQAQVSRNHNQTGTGLGLCLCKSMVEKMGGRIDFDSVPGAGVTFYAEFAAIAATEHIPAPTL